MMASMRDNTLWKCILYYMFYSKFFYNSSLALSMSPF
jgi:hypothetical protein